MLKILELQKALDEKRTALGKLERPDFESRRAELQVRVDEATEEMTAEERAEIETAIDAVNTEEAEFVESENSLKSEIEKLEREIAEEEAKAPESVPDERTMREVNKTMEVRETKEYMEAFANYIKTGKDNEVRTLLTQNAAENGTVPVPTLVYDTVKTAWNRDGIMSRVRKTYLRGNLKVGFELDADDAEIHVEGITEVSEEDLTLGVVELKPQSIKKWISISDEVLDMGAEDFLAYIYDELTYRIAKKAADTLVSAIATSTAAGSATAVPVGEVSVSAIGVGTVANALGALSGNAVDNVVIMNKATWSEFKTAQYAAQYPIDPFEGLPVLFSDALPSFATATSGQTFAIVGDLNYGALANLPNGDEIQIKYDDTTLMTSDLVRILGREYVGIAPVAPNAFANIKKA